MPKQHHLYIRPSPEIDNLLENCDNKSELVRLALLRYADDETGVDYQINNLNRECENMEITLTEKKAMLKKLQEHKKLIQDNKDNRPDGYEESVTVLCNIRNNNGLVSIDDIHYQADRLNLSLERYKSFLWRDGVYDKLLGL
jgi:hypothetical protein